MGRQVPAAIPTPSRRPVGSARRADLAQWLRLQLGGGKSRQAARCRRALVETHRPQIVAAPRNPETDRAGFYGLGWNVSYDDKGRVRLGHSGAFDLGAATAVYLSPPRTRHRRPHQRGADRRGRGDRASFLDLVHTGAVAADYIRDFGET